MPSIVQPVNAPMRGPMLPPTNAYTDPAEAKWADSRTKPALTTSTSRPAIANANGAALPTMRAGSGPTTDIASVGAITPIDSAAVPPMPSTRRSRGVVRMSVIVKADPFSRFDCPARALVTGPCSRRRR